MCVARTPPIFKKRNGNFIVFNTGLKGSFFLLHEVRAEKKIWESEVQRANPLSPVIRGEDEVRECNVPLAFGFGRYALLTLE